MKLLELNQKEFSAFQDFIYKKSGIHIAEAKRSLLSNRLRSRLKVGGFKDFQSYYDFITASPGQSELDAFFDVVTTHESFFFRTGKHFEWFGSDFIQEMTKKGTAQKDPKQIRVWSAACSTGEEAYSIAISLEENRFKLRDWDLQIVGTDISEKSLDFARKGVYKERSIEPVSEKQRRRFFTQVGENKQWKAKQSLTNMVDFHNHNLMNQIQLPKFDCIFIRNVLIYFDAESKQTVTRNLIRSLADGGYLVVGPSEGIYNMLGSLKKHTTFLYQKC